jgi:hypothetical protein
MRLANSPKKIIQAYVRDSKNEFWMDNLWKRLSKEYKEFVDNAQISSKIN